MDIYNTNYQSHQKELQLMYIYAIKDKNGEIKIKYHWEIYVDTPDRIYLCSVKTEELSKYLDMLKCFIKTK